MLCFCVPLKYRDLFYVYHSWFGSAHQLWLTNYINRWAHTCPTFLASAWWKQKASADFELEADRWSELVLHRWLAEFVDTAIAPYPIWYWASVFLQARLNKFSCDIMGQSTPQLAADVVQHTAHVGIEHQTCGAPCGCTKWRLLGPGAHLVHRCCFFHNMHKPVIDFQHRVGI